MSLHAYQNHLFYGVSDTRFGPNESMTRAMLVAVLYRMAGSPAVTGTPAFTRRRPECLLCQRRHLGQCQ